MDENLYKLLTWFTGIAINANDDMIPFITWESLCWHHGVTMPI